MNEKVLKNVNNVMNSGVSRGKSGDKSALQHNQVQNAQTTQGRMSTSNGTNQQPLNQSSSQKKIKTVSGGVGNNHSGYTFSSGSGAGINANAQSRDKSLGGGA